MGFEGIEVTPGRRTRERGRCTQVPNIIHAGLRQGEERFDRHPCDCGKPFDLTHQGDQMVGTHRSSCVVQRAVIVRDFEASTIERRNELGGDGVARNGKPAASGEPSGSDLGIGKRHQRMNRSGVLMGGEHIETRCT